MKQPELKLSAHHGRYGKKTASRTRQSPLPPPGQPAPRWLFRLGCQALAAQHWPLARGCFTDCLLQTGPASDHAELAGIHGNLALCALATGHHGLARQHLRQACQYQPQDRQIRTRLAELAALEQQRRTLPWFHPAAARDGELSLTPLAEHHLAALHWQQRDPAIARNANLQPLHSYAEVCHWFECLQQQPQRFSYAVMHHELGFCGLVGGNIAGADGWFYLWTGTDWQGRGLGSRALRLACRQLARSGVQRLLSACWPDNHASHRTLQRAGLRRQHSPGILPEAHHASHHQRPVQFWYRPLHRRARPRLNRRQLQQMIDRLEAGFTLSPGPA